MDGKKRSGKPPGEVFRGFSKDALALLEARGLRAKELLLCASGDMDNEGSYCAAWVAMDRENLIIAMGKEAVYKQKGNKRLRTKAELYNFSCTPLCDIEKLSVERYSTTGRLIGRQGGEDVALLRFSIGKAKQFQHLCDLHRALREGKDTTALLEEANAELHCPKCGERYPNKKNICPHCAPKSSTTKRLFRFFGGYKKQVATILLLMVALTAFDAVMPKIGTEMLFDKVLGGDGGAYTTAQRLVMLGWLVLAVVGLRLLNLVARMGTDYIQASIVPHVIYDIKLKIFSAMQRLSVGFYSSKQTGSLMERVTEDAMNIQYFFTDGLPFIFLNTFTLLGVLGMMFYTDVKLTLLVLVALPLILTLLMLGDRMFRRLHHKVWANSAALTSMVSDNINGQRVIKVFSKENEEAQRFGRFSGALRAAEIAHSDREQTLFPVFTALILCLTTIVLALGGNAVLNGTLKPGELIAFTIYMNMLSGPIEFLSWVSNWWARCVDSAHRVFEITDTEAEIEEPEHPVLLAPFRGSVELLELDFEYEPARPVIKKLNLRVEAGEMLGIVGKTGAGKTTIANLISRLYDPKAGCVRIDGVDVKALSIGQLRQNIGLVSQDIYLFAGSVAANIRYAKPEATVSEVMAAAKAAAAHDFIMKLPDAYETRVGNGGQALSGGERQRVSIARAILQNPKILILDEATAAMDTATERSIQESLGKLKAGRTTIAIAHRLSTLRDADKLAVIENGQLKECGSFDALLKQKGEFFNLYQMQNQAMAAMATIDGVEARADDHEHGANDRRRKR
ncbi:MAG: ABC transporter ATP-binding protein/permease [Oscillospiraceae bacterium]|jgi:ATP-binding cassette subfamily B protein|nr:ABC transporter ATP-binding protein/permease [Oscillospiraceae bacterium]